MSTTTSTCFHCFCWATFCTLVIVMHLEKGRADYPSDMISTLPDQPPRASSLRQYSGYVTVDESAGRAFFYYFVEAREGQPSSMPLTLWLNGGPGCSSLGGGAFSEIGPLFPTTNNGLVMNEESWSRATNLLFLESPAGVGFSYSNTTQDYHNQTDKGTARDNFIFLLNWLEKFPEYKGRDFYITGESYAGHYIPELAALIKNYMTSYGTDTLNLKAIAIGNPLLNYVSDTEASFVFLWSHGVNNDAVYEAVMESCDWTKLRENSTCEAAIDTSNNQMGPLTSFYDVTADVCVPDMHMQEITLRRMMRKAKGLSQGTPEPDPCISSEVDAYLNRPEVQAALHANTTKLPYPWTACSQVLKYDHSQSKINMIPVLEALVSGGLRVLIYSGDQDSVIPLIGTRTLINQLAKKLSLNTTISYGAWYYDDQVAGWTQAYGSQLTYATVRGAGHMVPLSQPSQALTLFKAFLAAKPLPSKPQTSI